MLWRAADGATFTSSESPAIIFPWRHTIATWLHSGNKSCWRLTDSAGTAVQCSVPGLSPGFRLVLVLVLVHGPRHEKQM